MNLYRVFRNVSFGSLGLWGLDLDIYIVVGCFFFFVDKISYPTVDLKSLHFANQSLMNE